MDHVRLHKLSGIIRTAIRVLAAIRKAAAFSTKLCRSRHAAAEPAGSRYRITVLPARQRVQCGQNSPINLSRLSYLPQWIWRRDV